MPIGGERAITGGGEGDVLSFVLFLGIPTALFLSFVFLIWLGGKIDQLQNSIRGAWRQMKKKILVVILMLVAVVSGCSSDKGKYVTFNDLKKAKEEIADAQRKEIFDEVERNVEIALRQQKILDENLAKTWVLEAKYDEGSINGKPSLPVNAAKFSNMFYVFVNKQSKLDAFVLVIEPEAYQRNKFDRLKVGQQVKFADAGNVLAGHFDLTNGKGYIRRFELPEK